MTAGEGVYRLVVLLKVSSKFLKKLNAVHFLSHGTKYLRNIAETDGMKGGGGQ